MAKYLYTIAIILTFTPLLGAEEKKSPEKITIAVMNFQANNCSDSMAKVATDMISGKLFETDAFIMLERNQMDIIVKEQGYAGGKKCTESKCAVEIGKMLSVQKMVVGSVNKLKEYKVEVRIINVADGAVDLFISKNAADQEDFEKITDSIVQKIEFFYRGYSDISGNFDIYLAIAGLHALGDLTKGTGFGYGGHINFAWNSPFGLGLPIMLTSGIYSFPPQLKSIAAITMVPIEIYISYPIALMRNIKFFPSFGAGYMLSWIKYDNYEWRKTGFMYKTGFFYNPLIAVRGEFDILLFHRWYLVGAPKYAIFFESSRIGHIIGIDLGMKMLL